MMRDHHSASSVRVAMRCMRRWAYEYIDGRRDPDVAWDDVADAPHSRARTLALGKAAGYRLGDIPRAGTGTSAAVYATT